MSEKKTKKTGYSFEEDIERLDEIVSALERGEAPLEESLKLYEEGARLAVRCETALKQAEQRVLKLAKTPEGTIEAVKMEVSDSEA
ncbi:MAG: exodeoxyribonuclease VII small subunit [Oscillospiraceae bacterium]|nr:exodeoxyribonuclease VII small subunit [Oscillospiraceae bacterium]